MPELNIVSQPNAAVNSARKATNQNVGTIAATIGNTTDVVAQLAAIAAAINAKPSA